MNGWLMWYGYGANQFLVTRLVALTQKVRRVGVCITRVRRRPGTLRELHLYCGAIYIFNFYCFYWLNKRGWWVASWCTFNCFFFYSSHSLWINLPSIVIHLIHGAFILYCTYGGENDILFKRFMIKLNAHIFSLSVLLWFCYINFEGWGCRFSIKNVLILSLETEFPAHCFYIGWFPETIKAIFF